MSQGSNNGDSIFWVREEERKFVLRRRSGFYSTYAVGCVYRKKNGRFLLLVSPISFQTLVPIGDRTLQRLWFNSLKEAQHEAERLCIEQALMG